MTRLLLNPGDDFDRVFAGITHSAWRWECQGNYDIDTDALDRWRARLPFAEDDGDRQWRPYIQSLRARGIPFQRVRMLTDPLTEYLHWSLEVTDWNIAIGEDIRWLDQHTAHELGLPTYDFYLLDDNRVLVLFFDENTVLTGEELIADEPDVLHRHRPWRELAWQHAVHHNNYRAAHKRT